MPSARAFAVIMFAKLGSSPPSASATMTATSLADLVTMARIAVSTRIVSPRLEVKLGWGLCGGMSRHWQLGRELYLALLQPLKQQVKGHYLGERSRMARGVGVGRLHHRA